LDVGRGTGNFLMAARASGYAMSGTELDPGAARFEQEQERLKRILSLTISDSAKQHPNTKFDV
jgi:ubiquinone/menaquinone biosynthesis C-methylase UbiE